ncbi:uncharacterized protein PHALS_13431 [Plasmopara halstedii]|uniref:Uncharacterized protein n=1 Tax=Plasmopara halstedii TaxID=4781 RepID=A0A0N7L641_PLAHL|nr:uncharacterized protein PHALS_13431 [Plasmopara halstedii]CEG43219.1 hypothetical protein PHALS_13431 [Plasmopara halstedii]|eukprot:XP_024579588.1 hypothetical protein PHALS_13431 [Plasmopara halstedii]
MSVDGRRDLHSFRDWRNSTCLAHTILLCSYFLYQLLIACLSLMLIEQRGDSPLHILNFPASIHTLINKDIQKKSDDQCLFGCP